MLASVLQKPQYRYEDLKVKIQPLSNSLSCRLIWTNGTDAMSNAAEHNVFTKI